MKLSRLCAVAAAVASAAFAGSASAIPINVGFNISAGGTFTSNTGDVTSATTITTGSPTTVAAILFNNIGLVFGQAITLNPNPMGVIVGSVFTKSFTTALGTFVETLTVQSVSPTANALGVIATGMIVQTAGVPNFDPTPVTWSAAYTQNAGTGTQINASFNNATAQPTQIPEPTSLALVGLALVGAGFVSRKRKSA